MSRARATAAAAVVERGLGGTARTGGGQPSVAECIVCTSIGTLDRRVWVLLCWCWFARAGLGFHLRDNEAVRIGIVRIIDRAGGAVQIDDKLCLLHLWSRSRRPSERYPS